MNNKRMLRDQIIYNHGTLHDVVKCAPAESRGPSRSARMNRENSIAESNESTPGLNRRDALKGMTAISLGLATGAYGAPKKIDSFSAF